MRSSYPSYSGSKKYKGTPLRSETNRPGRMKRLNAKLQAEPEFAAHFTADRAARMEIINAKSLRRTVNDLDRIAEEKRRSEAEKCAIENALSSYAFDCPQGTWTGRLEQIIWKQPTTLVLCFIDMATGNRYQLERQKGTCYRPLDGTHDFQADAAPGDIFQLRTRKTKHGYPDLKSARKITQPLQIVVIKSRKRS